MVANVSDLRKLRKASNAVRDPRANRRKAHASAQGDENQRGSWVSCESGVGVIGFVAPERPRLNPYIQPLIGDRALGLETVHR